MTPLLFLIAFVILDGTRSISQKSLKESAFQAPLVASIMAKFEQILWERFWKYFHKGHERIICIRLLFAFVTRDRYAQACF